MIIAVNPPEIRRVFPWRKDASGAEDRKEDGLQYGNAPSFFGANMVR